MTSPLLPYINAYLLIPGNQGAPVVTSGRVTKTASNTYLLGAYITRQQASGTTTGADYVPTQTNTTDMLPGTSGVVYLYAGYAIRFATVSSGYNLEINNTSSLNWTALNGTNTPTWLTTGLAVMHKQGNEPIKYSKIERISGRHGNAAIDMIINNEIGGIPIIIRSGDTID